MSDRPRLKKKTIFFNRLPLKYTISNKVRTSTSERNVYFELRPPLTTTTSLNLLWKSWKESHRFNRPTRRKNICRENIILYEQSMRIGNDFFQYFMCLWMNFHIIDARLNYCNRNAFVCALMQLCPSMRLIICFVITTFELLNQCIDVFTC